MSDVVPLLFHSEASTFIETRQNYAAGGPESKYVIVFTMNVYSTIKVPDNKSQSDSRQNLRKGMLCYYSYCSDCEKHSVTCIIYLYCCNFCISLHLQILKVSSVCVCAVQKS